MIWKYIYNVYSLFHNLSEYNDCRTLTHLKYVVWLFYGTKQWTDIILILAYLFSFIKHVGKNQWTDVHVILILANLFSCIKQDFLQRKILQSLVFFTRLFPNQPFCGYNFSAFTCVGHFAPDYSQITAHHAIIQWHVNMVILAITHLATIFWVLWCHTDGLYRRGILSINIWKQFGTNVYMYFSKSSFWSWWLHFC